MRTPYPLGVDAMIPTLGYEDDTTLSKSDVARVQLEEAIARFNACKFLPAITLARAAEEIFAKLLQRRLVGPEEEPLTILISATKRTG